MPYVDTKVTAWIRYYVSEEEATQIAEKIKKGEIQTDADFCSYCDDNELSATDTAEVMFDTAEAMTPEENGAPCIEVYSDEGEWLSEIEEGK